MKTEKRLTMALSVLVALMMLAVPLASSSNLFVDGGQTNSNGDAPLIGADTSVEIVEVWIINDDASFNKLNTSYGKTLTDFVPVDGSWNEACVKDGPWIAVAFKALKAGEATVTVSNPNSTLDKNTYTFTKPNCTVDTTYVFTAYLDGKLTNGKLPSGLKPESQDKIDALQITDKSRFYTDNYTVTAKVGSDGVEVTKTFNADLGKSYDISFNLNDVNENGKKSLDKVGVDGNRLISGNGYSWYKDNDGMYHAVVNSSTTLSVLISAMSSAVSKVGYTLDSWKDADGNIYSTTGDNSNIDKNMTLSATWLLDKDDYVEVPVNVVFDDQTTEYVKAYNLETTDKNKITVDKDSLNEDIISIAKLSIYGIVVNDEDSPVGAKVYSIGAVTYDNGKELPSGQISSKSELTVTYVFDNVKYSKILIHSDAFKDGKDVTLYSLKKSDYMYSQVYDALTRGSSANENSPAIKNFISAKGGIDKNGYQLTENGYLLKGWNSAERLDSTRNAPSELTLDSELSGYSIVFMVNGQFEVVYVPYGELSADKTKLDINGVNHWVSISYDAFDKLTVNKDASATTAFAQFNFSAANNVKTIEDAAKTAASNPDYNANKPIYVLIACFTPSSSTAYALFSADKGDFGNQYIDRIIIPGEAEKAIPLPSVAPSYEQTNVFVGYTGYTSSGDNQSKYGDKNTLIGYNADAKEYKYTIIFYNGSDVNGILYYKSVSTVSTTLKTTELVAFSYKGTAYNAADLDLEDSSLDITKAFNNVLYPAKDGYKVTQWKDTDGNVMLDKVTPKYDRDGKLTGGDYSVEFNKISSDMSFYANFEAKEYYIIYSGNTATMTNNMKQIVKVDENVNLFSDSTFSNDGYKLKEWNTRPDGKGTTYALGASFSLNGEQYEDLEIVQSTYNGTEYVNVSGFTLYAIWEKVGSSDNPSGNTDGDNDNSNTDTYLLAGILVVIIILIIVVAVVLRKKN